MKAPFVLSACALLSLVALRCSVSENGSCADDSTCTPSDGGLSGDVGASVNDAGPSPEDAGGSSDADAQPADSAGSTVMDAAPDTGPSCDPTQTPSQNACVIDDALAFFVSPTGSDTTGTGTMEAPVATVAKGIFLASSSSTVHRVIVCAAAYAETISLVSPANDVGLGVFGGVLCPASDAGAAWTYTGALPVVTAPAPGYALTAVGLANPLDLEDLQLVAMDAATQGESSVAAFFDQASNVVLARVSLVAGNASSSSANLAGTTPATPLPVASNGADGEDGGASVTCACANSGDSTSGGNGGTNGGSLTTGAGGDGTPSLGGGQGGQAGDLCFAVVDGGASGTGTVGADAPAASAGAGATSPGSLTSAGWAPAAGTAGAAGTPGQGGGGGTSQGQTAVGGGGGCGGCGGSGATPGQGGGASIGALVFESSVTLTSCMLSTANGENGGAGAAGQAGAPGGLGGNNEGAGCPGGVGGTGGAGGASGGGAGGLSVGVAWSGTKPTLDSATQAAFVHGTPGTGGAGGSTTAPDEGAPGVVQVTYP